MTRITTLRDAIEADIQSAGGWAAVAKQLYQVKYQNSPDAADRHLRNSVDPNHSQKLCTYQHQIIMRMAKKASGRCLSLEFVCDDIGYTVPAPLTKEQQQVDLAYQLVEMSKRLERMVEAVKNLN